MGIGTLIGWPRIFGRTTSLRFRRLHRMLSQYTSPDAQMQVRSEIPGASGLCTHQARFSSLSPALQGYLNWTERCNSAVKHSSKLDSWHVEGQPVGYLLPEYVRAFRQLPW